MVPSFTSTQRRKRILKRNTVSCRLRYVFFVAISVACAILGLTDGAWAEPSGTFRFAWAAPDECPSRGQVQAEIARLVGGDLLLRQGGELEVKATVSHSPFWSAELTTQHAGQTGRRTIEAPSCKAVADATALIVALLIDPDAVAAKAQAPTPEAISVPEAPKARASQVVFGTGIHLQGRVGTLPGADIGIGLGIGMAGPRWRTDLRWTYGLRRDQVASLPSGASGRFNIAAGSLTECFNLGQAKLGFGPCVSLEMGRVSVEGYGTTTGFSKHSLWLALGGGALVSFAIGPHLRASMEADVVVPMYRPDYVFQDVPGVVFKAPAVGGRALVEVSWHF
jgi:hypothetical protein